MPTECERSEASPAATTSGAATTSAAAITTTQQQPLSTANIEQKDLHDMEMNSEMTTSTGSTSSSSTANGHNGSTSNGGKKTSITSPDPTAYVAKARVTRPTPPPPSYNPMQFVQIKPCNLYQTAQQQLKKAEEVKKIKEIKKEEPEDWQNNLDNWKSSRRKRVEHIIDRVVEVKKLELEEHDRSRRKSKTFSEMIEERGERGVRGGRAKLVSLAVYNEDESNDLSDLGIGTSSASGKSSLSEDYDNNSVMSDNADLDRAIFEHNHQHPPGATTREYISSPGYDTSSSTAPASSPDPCEYTYEGAIQDYKQRVSRATSGGSAGFKLNTNGAGATNGVPTSKEPTPERSNNGSADVYPTRRGSKIEERLIGFEVFSPNDSQEAEQRSKVDVPKIDISKRKEIFESTNSEPKSQATTSNGVPKVALRDRFQPTATEETNAKKEMKRLSGDITSSIKDRLQSLEQQQNLVNSSSSSSSGGGAKNSSSSSAMVVDVPVPPLKERLSSLQNAVTKEEVKKPPVVLVDARQLEIMKDEEENAKLRRKQEETTTTTMTTTTMTTILPMELSKETKNATTQPLEVESQMESEVDRDDSGIHVEEERLLEQQQQQLLLQAQEQQLNEAIAALVNEEKQLEEAANAVNQIEAEFAGLALDGSGSGNGSTSATTTTTNEHPCEMEFSINEALELALEAIDKETTTSTSTATTTTTTTTLTATKIPTTTTFTSISTSATSTSTKSTSTTITHGNKTSNHNNNNNKYDAADSIDQLLIMENPTPDDKSSAPTQDEPQDGDDAEVERKIQNEPIYENIASTTHADTEPEVVPSSNTNINQTYKSQDQSQDNNIPNIESFPVAPETLPKSVDSLAHEQHQQGSVAPFEPTGAEDEPYYQVPKSSEPYYDAPKHLRPVPVYENIEVFYSGLENSTLAASIGSNAFQMEPPKEKPPPPPTDSPPSFDDDDDDAIVDGAEPVEPWTTTTDNTYETISNRLPNGVDGSDPHPSPPIKRMNSTKRIKKELRHKRSSFLGLEGSADDDLESYLELTVAPPPDMAQLLQEERRLEKQLYLKAGLCDSSDTGESRDSGVSENHSRQSSEPFTNSSEEADRPSDDAPLSLNTTVSTGLKQEEFFYQNELPTGQTQTLLQTVKGNSAESWTESATEAAAATQSLTEATATANAKMLSIEEKIREQEEVLRVERELLQLEQEELKRQRENLILRENLARRELQHGAKMLMSANRHSMQDLNGGGGGGGGGVVAGFENPSMMPAPQQQQPQQIYANVPNLPHQQYYQVETDYRKSMSDLNEFSKRLMLAPGGGGVGAPLPPTKPMRSMHVSTTNGHDEANFARQRHSLNAQGYGGSLVKIAGSSTGPGLGPAPSAAAPQRQSTGAIYTNYQLHQSAQNLANVSNGHVNNTNGNGSNGHLVHAPNAHLHSNMTRNTLHALSATPKPKYTDGWVQVQNRKSFDSNLANDPAWLSAYQQKRKSVPDAYHYNNNNNHWLVQEAEQRRLAEQHQLRSVSATNTPSHQPAGGVAKGAASSGNGKPLPDSIIQTLTERVQSKGIGERKRFDNYNNVEKSPLHAAASYQHHSHPQQQQQQQTMILSHPAAAGNGPSTRHALDLAPLGHMIAPPVNGAQDKVLSVSGKKKCSHCGDELGRGAAMIIESLLLFYHINCFKCCVCHVQLGDGLNGTDVRVRNHKLHCQNCYSSDDGIKFSCV